MIKMPFSTFEKLWRQETFMEGAFGLEQDFEAYLDDPTTSFEDSPYEQEINQYMLPTFEDDDAIENYLRAKTSKHGVQKNG